MKIVILNGHPGDVGAAAFDRYLEALKSRLASHGHHVAVLMLRDLEAKYCTGCWGCWVKTPGQCIFNDDSHIVSRAMINSDRVVFASPVIMGYVSALMKKYMDKTIQLIHPYITVVQAEAHHQARYPESTYPLGVLLLERTPGTDDEDIAITNTIFERMMLNFKSRHALTAFTSQPVEEVANAMRRI